MSVEQVPQDQVQRVQRRRKRCTVEAGRSGAGAVLARRSHHTIVTRPLVEQYSNPYPLRNTSNRFNHENHFFTIYLWVWHT